MHYLSVPTQARCVRGAISATQLRFLIMIWCASSPCGEYAAPLGQAEVDFE